MFEKKSKNLKKSRNRSFNSFFHFSSKKYLFSRFVDEIILSTHSCLKVIFVSLSPSTPIPPFPPKWPSNYPQMTPTEISDTFLKQFGDYFVIILRFLSKMFEFCSTFLRFWFRFWISIFRSQILDLLSYSQISFRFSDFEMFFRDIFWSFKYFFTTLEREDPQYLYTFFFVFVFFSDFFVEISRLILWHTDNKQCHTCVTHGQQTTPHNT